MPRKKSIVSLIKSKLKSGPCTKKEIVSAILKDGDLSSVQDEKGLTNYLSVTLCKMRKAGSNIVCEKQNGKRYYSMADVDANETTPPDSEASE